MRRILTGCALAALLAVVPALARADNQETANKIAQTLRESGKLSSYKIGVKYQSGTAWLRGRVSDQEQMDAAVKLAFQTPGVTRVVNELSLPSAEAVQSVADVPAASPQKAEVAENSTKEVDSVPNPLRGRDAALAVQKKTKPSLAKRLEAIMSRGSAKEAPTKEASASAEQLSTSYNPAPVKQVSAEEWQGEAPQQMTVPRRVQPVAPAYMAMQPGMRGPMAPNGAPLPMYTAAANSAGVAPARYDQPSLPNYAWPSYAAYPNYAAVTYPKQYSPTAWPYIGPFYPYPQVPLGWRKVTLEWDSGWWFLDFKDQPASCWRR